ERPAPPAPPRPPKTPQLRGHRAGEMRRLLAVRRRLPGRLHPRRRRREHPRRARLGGRGLRRRLRDQPQPLHLLRLLRDRLPLRRDHDGPRLRDGRLRPHRPDLHQGDAARRVDRADPAEQRGRRDDGRPLMEGVIFFIAAIGAVVGAIGVVAARNPFYSVLALIAHLFSLAVLFLLLPSAFVAAAQVVVYAGAVMVLYVFVVAYVGDAH